jgi:hypothetical protein
MKRFGYPSVTFELIILFVSALIVAVLLAVGYPQLERNRALTALEAVRIADRATVVRRLMEDTPGESRPKLVEHFRQSNMLVAWSDRGWPDPGPPEDDTTQLIRNLLISAEPGLSTGDVRVLYKRSDDAAGARISSELSRNWTKAGPFP